MEVFQVLLPGKREIGQKEGNLFFFSPSFSFIFFVMMEGRESIFALLVCRSARCWGFLSERVATFPVITCTLTHTERKEDFGPGLLGLLTNDDLLSIKVPCERGLL